ncbi:MAG: DegV family protein [Clostridia bacterium]|nr:DegV family protein [Clostridia bacterium]
MVRIISDTSTMYSTQQAKEAGFSVSPLSVSIAGESYRELDEIIWDRFVELIRQGNMPTSSQPAIGEVMDLYEAYAGEEIVNIAMADGLSGTYQSAVAAAEGDARITVINSTTLCGPHRYMVEQAAKLAAQGATKQEIIDAVHTMMQSDLSFLMPDDFDYLRRGGRLSPLVSFVGKTIRLAPVLTQSEDGKQLTMAGVKRSFKQAIEHVIKALEKHGVGDGWRIYITHAAAIEKAEQAKAMLLAQFPTAAYEIHPLTPAFITQGGPGCVAVQVIKEL